MSTLRSSVLTVSPPRFSSPSQASPELNLRSSSSSRTRHFRRTLPKTQLPSHPSPSVPSPSVPSPSWSSAIEQLEQPLSFRGIFQLLLRVLLLFSPLQQTHFSRLFNLPIPLETEFIQTHLLGNGPLFAARIFSIAVCISSIIFDSLFYSGALPSPVKGHWMFPACFGIVMLVAVVWNVIICLGVNPGKKGGKFDWLRRNVFVGELVVVCLPVGFMAMVTIILMFNHVGGLMRMYSILTQFFLGNAAISIFPSMTCLLVLAFVIHLVAHAVAPMTIFDLGALFELWMNLGIALFTVMLVFSLQSTLRATFISRMEVCRATRMFERHQKRVARLLQSLLPPSIAAEILSDADRAVCVHRQNPGAVFIFVRIVDFESFVGCRAFSATEVVRILNRLFLKFDCAITEYKLLRLKTAFETYICCAGLPDPVDDDTHLALGLNAAFAILRNRPVDFFDPTKRVRLQIGLEQGDVVSGVLSTKFPQYDSWGLCLNVASRLSTAVVWNQQEQGRRDADQDTEYTLYDGVHVTEELFQERLMKENYAVRINPNSEETGHLCRLKGVGGGGGEQSQSDVRRCILLDMQRDPERPNLRQSDIILEEQSDASSSGSVLEEAEEESAVSSEGDIESYSHPPHSSRSSVAESRVTETSTSMEMRLEGFVDIARDVGEDEDPEVTKWFAEKPKDDAGSLFRVSEESALQAFDERNFVDGDDFSDNFCSRCCCPIFHRLHLCADTSATSLASFSGDMNWLTLGFRRNRQGLAKLNAEFWSSRFMNSVGLNRAIFILVFVAYILPQLAWEVYFWATECPDKASRGCTETVLDLLVYRVLPWVLSSQAAILLLYTPLYTLHWISFTIVSMVAFTFVFVGDLATRNTDPPMAPTQPYPKVSNYVLLILISALDGIHFYGKASMLVAFVGSLATIYYVRYPASISTFRLSADAVFVVYCLVVSLLRHLHDLQNVYQQAVGICRKNLADEGRERSMNVVLSVLPKHIVHSLLEDEDLSSGRMIGESYDLVGFVAADLVGFTALATRVSSYELITLLNRCFTRFYTFCDRRPEITKATLLGDMFIALSGCSNELSLHLLCLADVALEILDYSEDNEDHLQFRTSLTAGPLITGVILDSVERRSLHWDIYGNSVKEMLDYNHYSQPSQILCSPAYYEALHAQVRKRRSVRRLEQSYDFGKTEEVQIGEDSYAFWLRYRSSGTPSRRRRRHGTKVL